MDTRAAIAKRIDDWGNQFSGCPVMREGWLAHITEGGCLSGAALGEGEMVVEENGH